MLRGRSFACSSARRIGSLRKKVPQVLPRPGNVSYGTFFHWIQWKNLFRLLLPKPAEEPSPLSSIGSCGRTHSSASISNCPFHMRGRTFVFNLSHHTSLMSSILRPLTLPNEDTRLEH